MRSGGGSSLGSNPSGMSKTDGLRCALISCRAWLPTVDEAEPRVDPSAQEARLIRGKSGQEFVEPPTNPIVIADGNFDETTISGDPALDDGFVANGFGMVLGLFRPLGRPMSNQPARRRRTASASRPMAASVSSQPRQASVTLTP